MKPLNIVVSAAGIMMISMMACNTVESNSSATFSLANETDSVSYGLGVSIGNNIKTGGVEKINADVFAQAIRDVFSGDSLKMNKEAADILLNSYFEKLQGAKSEKNRKEGEEFLEQNKAKQGVVVLPSGLQYMVMQEGKGDKPAATDKVTVHYHGTFINGDVFDSSVERGEPVSFPVNGVIPGWQEALQLMQAGSKWKLFVPSDLAYGEQGAGKDIAPHTAIVFEVELLSINK